MVGYVIGRGGEHINNIQSNCGVRLQFQNGTLSHRDILHDIQSSVFECDLHHFADVPGTDCRIATISGTHEGCQRAKKWVDDLIAEVSTITHTPCKNSIM